MRGSTVCSARENVPSFSLDAVWIVNCSTLRPLSHPIRLGINLAPAAYSVTQFVLVDHANDELLPNTNPYLLMETIVRFSKKLKKSAASPKPSHDSTKLNRNPILQVLFGKGIIRLTSQKLSFVRSHPALDMQWIHTQTGRFRTDVRSQPTCSFSRI